MGDRATVRQLPREVHERKDEQRDRDRDDGVDEGQEALEVPLPIPQPALGPRLAHGEKASGDAASCSVGRSTVTVIASSWWHATGAANPVLWCRPS